VYVNTLMLQRVLAEPARMARMTSYGTFDLDMDARLDLDWREAA